MGDFVLETTKTQEEEYLYSLRVACQEVGITFKDVNASKLSQLAELELLGEDCTREREELKRAQPCIRVGMEIDSKSAEILTEEEKAEFIANEVNLLLKKLLILAAAVQVDFTIYELEEGYQRLCGDFILSF